MHNDNCNKKVCFSVCDQLTEATQSKMMATEQQCATTFSTFLITELCHYVVCVLTKCAYDNGVWSMYAAIIIINIYTIYNIHNIYNTPEYNNKQLHLM